MTEETAKQLRCVILYYLTENRNAYGNEAQVDNFVMNSFFVSLERAKEEAEHHRRAGSWFEICPFSPCLGFRFDSKWLLVRWADFENFYPEVDGQILCHSHDLGGKPDMLFWRGKTSEQIWDMFPGYCIEEVFEPTSIRDATCMTDVDLSSFTTLRSRPVDQWDLIPFQESTTNYYLNWEKDIPYRIYKSHATAKRLDRQLAKFFPAIPLQERSKPK